MNNLEHREAELRAQLEQIKKEKVRAICPEVYDWLVENSYFFEDNLSAYKPLNDNFEVGVSLSKDSVIITIYDRTKTEVRVDKLYRREIDFGSTAYFTPTETEPILQYIKELQPPKKYLVTVSCTTPIVAYGNEEDIHSYIQEAVKDFGDYINKNSVRSIEIKPKDE